METAAGSLSVVPALMPGHKECFLRGSSLFVRPPPRQPRPFHP
jgi:hypothetical protein